MLGKMRVISSVLLSAVIMLLLTFRVLPHHHHTLHIPGSSVVVETLHFGIEECHDDSDSSHGGHESCPSDQCYYIARACEELEYQQSIQNFDFSPAILPVSEQLRAMTCGSVHAPPYINIKIPDSGVAVLSLRAPPYTV